MGEQPTFKLIAVETHPIQYKAPLFRMLAEHPGLDFHVLYAMIPDQSQQGDGFGVAFEWDIPVLEGYSHTVLDNMAKVPSMMRFSGCDTPGIYTRLKSMQPDAVLVNGWVVKTCLQTLWACKRLGIPCWVRGEANLLRHRAWWKHIIHRQLLHMYDGYLAIGQANRDFYRFHKCPEHRIGWAPYAVENDRFVQTASRLVGERDALRCSWNVPGKATVFLFSGKLIAKKRPFDLLQALSALPKELQAHVLMVGDGPLRAEAEALAHKQQLPVSFAGFVNQSRMPEAYAVADVLVLPSDAGETWGLVVNEAMASGRPAIVSDQVGCAADLIRPGETGAIYPCGDCHALANSMRAYCERPGRAGKEGIAAQERIRHYDIRCVATGIWESLFPDANLNQSLYS